MEEAYTFSDVLIKPKHSKIRSRRIVDLSSHLGSIKLSLPIISSNMKTITGPEMAREMNMYGGLGILHRFNSINQAVKDYKETIKRPFPPWDIIVGVSIGVQKEDRRRFKALYKAGARIFCIDIAHGDCILMKEMLWWIRSQKIDHKNLILIAGNIATFNSFLNLASWGANIVKVGIGGGSVCETRKNTGVGVPQLFSLQEVFSARLIWELRYPQAKRIGIISDGGITSVGDISKALKYSDAVMVGGFIAGTTECPGKVFKNKEGQYYKVYMGSASGENKHSSNQETDFIEGIATEVLFRGHVKYVLKEIKDGLQSACSYVGVKNLEEFKDKCEFTHISSGSKSESKI